jgi:hypothetical protein
MVLADTEAKACVMQTQAAGTTLSPKRSRIVACIVPQPSTRPSLAACAPHQSRCCALQLLHTHLADGEHCG